MKLTGVDEAKTIVDRELVSLSFTCPRKAIHTYCKVSISSSSPLKKGEENHTEDDNIEYSTQESLSDLLHKVIPLELHCLTSCRMV